MTDTYESFGIRLWANAVEWHVEREGRLLFRGTERECSMFAEELMERLRHVRNDWRTFYVPPQSWPPPVNCGCPPGTVCMNVACPRRTFAWSYSGGIAPACATDSLNPTHTGER